MSAERPPPPPSYGPPPRKLFDGAGSGVWLIAALCLGACLITGFLLLAEAGRRKKRAFDEIEQQLGAAPPPAWTANGPLNPATASPGQTYFYVDPSGVIRTGIVPAPPTSTSAPGDGG